jgi:hypothetical protein
MKLPDANNVCHISTVLSEKFGIVTLLFIGIYIFCVVSKYTKKYEKTFLPSPVFYNLFKNKKQQTRSVTSSRSTVQDQNGRFSEKIKKIIIF